MKIFTLFLLFYKSHPFVSDIEFDKEHFEAYPNCGRLFGYEWHDARSRVVNSKESEIQYPWVVLIKHTIVQVFTNIKVKKNRKVRRHCSGTIVGNK